MLPKIITTKRKSFKDCLLFSTNAFSLVELIVILLTIAILAAIVIFVLRPAQHLAETRNSNRIADMHTLLDAVYAYAVDHDGNFPGSIDSTLRMIGTQEENCDVSCLVHETEMQTASSCLDLSSLLIDEYIIQIPYDPRFGSAEMTYYAVRRTNGGKMQVVACQSELGLSLQVSR